MSHPSLAERVAVDLRQAILSGRLRPGTRISDARVAAEMGISRAPVREAIRQLATRGLVREEPRRGAFVTRISPRTAHEVYECRRALEGLAARRLAGSPNALAHAARLQEIVDEMDSAALRRDMAAMADADHRFHLTLCELTDNRWLVRLYEQIADQSRLMQTLDAFAHAHSNVGDPRLLHTPIVEAIASGDPRIAEEAILRHIDTSEQLFLTEVPEVLHGGDASQVPGHGISRQLGRRRRLRPR
jgi:DNA-binding GntR family transcriptional regulator